MTKTENRKPKTENRKPRTENRSYGLALDIGTSTVCMSIFDMKFGKKIDEVRFTNKQKAYGQDVLSRINFTIKKKDGLHKLQDKIVRTINEAIEYFSNKYNISKINKIVVYGNTTMYHFLLGVPAYSLAHYPYQSNIASHISKEQNLNIINTKAEIFFIPIISSFIGGDTTSLILATNLYKSEEINLAIDLGTNGEIVLGNKDKIFATSVACGPAFEGYNISKGMFAKDGAIERVEFKDKIMYKVIGNVKPKGICGSGIIDLIAEMLRAGIIEKSGRIKRKEELKNKLNSEYIKRIFEDKFLVYSNQRKIFITQKDIRNIQLAKAAISSGVEILKKRLKIDNSEISKVHIAGAFGNYLNIENTLRIGLLPNSFSNKIEFVGNSSLKGAEIYLIRPELKNDIEKISKETKNIQLGNDKEFQKEFIKRINFGAAGI